MIPLNAHGALMTFSFPPGITIHALYDTGQSMSGARITVYAPGTYGKPWLSAISDEQGWSSLVPDPDMTGTWTIQARQAGNGAMIHIPMIQASSSGSGATPVSVGPNTLRRLLQDLNYFSRKNDPRTT